MWRGKWVEEQRKHFAGVALDLHQIVEPDCADLPVHTYTWNGGSTKELSDENANQSTQENRQYSDKCHHIAQIK